VNGVAAWKRRHAAARRLEPLESGLVDPWMARLDERPSADTYAAAARHLLEHGLTPAPDIEAMRTLWRRSQEDRELVRTISSRWEMSA
jgi:hypothetical protein